MNMEELSRVFAQKMKEVDEFVQGEDIKEMIGKESVDFYKESFANEGFTDETLEKWDDVNRRDPESKQYGRKQDGKFSAARTTAKILTGETSELRESVTYETIDKGVKVTSDKEYSAIHQFGGQGNAYGKHPFVMKARPYIGKSKKMKAKIEGEIKNQITTILKPLQK